MVLSRMEGYHQIDEKAQTRLDELMERNNEGTITATERKELAALGDEAERLSLENAFAIKGRA
jgi:hypothetical protein